MSRTTNSRKLTDRLKRCLGAEDWNTLHGRIQSTDASKNGKLKCEYETRRGEHLQHVMTYCRSSGRCFPHGIVKVIDHHHSDEAEEESNAPRLMFSPYTDEEKEMILLTLLLHKHVYDKNWETVQRLVATIPEPT